ncbi:unnamed protein product [Acanthoscelides obtectus]|uniref:Uncharacterized protein n=1 Tax=Acanthoscelides obtectus TaxID=200917 RepID=A0A9P0L9D7_ACAOB|nr:unnamed protein product [Acanthoscelides obtectus]CAK1633024.1 hypothetical protein AOBTE_LOCUS7882 [Acanthoscelides obtectus]
MKLSLKGEKSKYQQPQDPIKTSRIGKPQPTLHIPVFQQNPFLCVATILKEYIDRTASLREPDNDFLFVTYKKPHTRASKDTLSRWRQHVLGLVNNV